MKISKNKLRHIIKEEFEALLEYEQYVDEDGNVYDDEGNVSRRGREFGRRYGGGTYGLRGLPRGGGSSSRRKTSYVGQSANAEQIAAVESALEAKPNNFLQSILDQLKRGRGLSSKQKSIVKKIVMKHDPSAASLFEAKNEKLRSMIREILSETEEAVSVERLKALEGRPHRIDLNKFAAPNELRSYFRDAYAEGKKAEGKWYETAFGASESPDSDPDEPYWSVLGPYEVLIADEMGQKEAEAVSDALNAEYAKYLETQDMGDFGFAIPAYTPADHAS